MTKLLIVLIVVLAVVALAQLAKVYEITSRMRGKREGEISLADNRMNGKLMMLFMVVFYGFFIWLFFDYKEFFLPVSASEHGVALDELMNFNWLIVIAVFVLTNTLLFFFAFKYYDRPGAKAFYYPHNNKLELIWTVIPAIVLAVIIIYGLRTWNGITDEASEDAEVVEFYSKQFDWTARYPGPDGELGPTDFRLINGTNPLGIATTATIKVRLAEMAEEVADMKADIAENADITPDAALEEKNESLERLGRHRANLISLENRMHADIAEKGEGSIYKTGEDDIVIKESHMPLGKEVKMVFRSQDVIHSAFLPHFRAQMNTVPGMATTFKMVPTITTDSMRLITQNPDFNYILLCNKICGASHYNMQMDIVVESEEDYRAWLSEQKSFMASDEPAEVEAETAPEAVEEGTEEAVAATEMETAEVPE